VHPGEVAVEDDHVVAVEVKLCCCLEAVVGDIDGHALVLEAVDDRVGEGAGVFDDEHSHACAPA
jgi:hypothetical protein